MPRNRSRERAKPYKSMRRSPLKRPRTRCRKEQKSAKTHRSPVATLSRIPELKKMLGDKNELLENIDKMQSLEPEELKEKIAKIDAKIKKNKDSSKDIDLHRERVSLLAAYMAKNL